jgi:hypothetical protein
MKMKMNEYVSEQEVASGDYVIIEPFPEGVSRGKVKAQIAHVLLPEHVSYLKKQSLWPNQFADALDKKEKKSPDLLSFSSPTKSHIKSNNDKNGKEKEKRSAYYPNENENKSSDNDNDEEKEDEGNEEDMPEFVNPNHIGVSDSDSDSDSDSEEDTENVDDDDDNNNNKNGDDND